MCMLSWLMWFKLSLVLCINILNDHFGKEGVLTLELYSLRPKKTQLLEFEFCLKKPNSTILPITIPPFITHLLNMSIFVTMVIVFIFSLKYMNLFLIGWVIMIICKDMNEPNKNSLHVFFLHLHYSGSKSKCIKVSYIERKP